MEQIKEQLTDIKSMDMDELTEFIISLGEKKFRAKQIYEWIHVKHVESFDEMTNISKKFIQVLKDNAILISLKKEEVQVSKLDGTRKYLFALDDGNVIESVLMKYKHGNSVCISSQVGCRMGCRFCASTLDGLVRGLRPSEMIDQIYQIGKDIGERISNVVVMGTGEPLDNYDNLLRFIELLTDENGINISQRNLTVSTCGLVPRMKQLADEKLSITLALSLHASNQEKRKALMPVANSYDIHDVVDACKYYFAQTGRRVTFEYSLVGGVNDTAEDAAELSALVHGMNCHINLIPVNPIKERAIVAAQVPGVAVPALDGAENYIKTLDHGGYFEVTALSKEDLKKTELYHQNAERAKAQAAFADYGQYLDSLEMTATIKGFEPLYIQRIAQLTNKSNQFNLTTLRCSEDDIRAMAGDKTTSAFAASSWINSVITALSPLWRAGSRAMCLT